MNCSPQQNQRLFVVTVEPIGTDAGRYGSRFCIFLAPHLVFVEGHQANRVSKESASLVDEYRTGSRSDRVQGAKSVHYRYRNRVMHNTVSGGIMMQFVISKSLDSKCLEWLDHKSEND